MKAGDLYGYVDARGNQVIPPFFEDARGFSEGLAAVKLEGKWGYIAPDGTTKIPFQFECEKGMAGPFRQGLARVSRDGKWGHINKDAEFVTAPQYEMAYEFSEGMAKVKKDGRYGFVNLSGELSIPISFRIADAFSEGLASVNIGTGEAHKSVADACEVGFLNSQGDFVITPQFLATGRFSKGLCLVETEKYLQYITREGKIVWSSTWADISFFDPHHLLPPEALRNTNRS